MEVITVGPGLAARSFPGDGRPVLLVHGLSSNARLWDVVARHLVGHPGRGGRPARPRPAPPRCPTSSRMPPWPPPTTSPRCATTSAGARRSSQVSRGAATWCSSSRRIGRCTGSRWSTGGGCSSPTASPRSTTLGPSSRRRRSTGSPPRPSAPGSTRRIPGWSDEAVEATVGNLEIHVDGTVVALAHPRTTPRDRRQHARAPAAGAVRAGRVPGAAPRRGSGRTRRRAAAAAAIPHAELVAFPGGDHDLHAQHPEEVAALIGRLA